MTPERDLPLLLAGLRPQAHPGIYVFVTVPPAPAQLADEAVVTVSEPEGLTVVVPQEMAERHALPFGFAAAWLTLTVHSALDAVGLTASVAAALSEQGISANVVAGYHHDHLFVPADRREDALAALDQLSRTSREQLPGGLAWRERPG